jgi:hypothetical protein
MKKALVLSLPVAALILLVTLGALAVILLCISCATGIAAGRRAASLARDIVRGADLGGAVVTDKDLEGLPSCVRIWLRRSGIVGKPRIVTARLEQKGSMRPRKSGPWIPFRAVQFNRLDDPALIWTARVRAFPLVHLLGRDLYRGGHGHMLIRLLGVVPVADATGPEIDQGTLVRVLGEASWYPSFALSPLVSWEESGPSSARATIVHGGVTAAGTFRFDGAGDVVGFEAERYMESEGRYSLETWSVASSGHREFDGVRIPASNAVTWKLKDGDHAWLRMEVTSLLGNVPGL